MRASFSAVILTAVVVVTSAVAGTRSSSSVRPESLARMEAVTTYCQKADPASGPLYRDKLAAAMRGQSESEIAGDRNSSAYIKALAQANKTLAEVSDRTGVNGCAEFLADQQ